MTVKKRQMKEKINEVENSLKDIDFNIESEFLEETVHVEVYKKLSLSNPDNPAEIVSKMSICASTFFYLGSARAEAESILSREKTEYDLWMAKKMNELLTDKDFKSESAKKNYIYEEYSEEIQIYEARIRKAKWMYEKLDIAVKSFDKYVSLLQSMGAMLRRQSETDEEGFDIKDEGAKRVKKIKKSIEK